MVGPSSHNVTVLGAGSWGTALSLVLIRNGSNVTLWDRDSENLEKLNTEKVNMKYLPGVSLPEPLNFEPDLCSAISTAEHIVIAIPSNGVRPILKKLFSSTLSPRSIVFATKGLEPDSGKFLHELLKEEAPSSVDYAILSGPSFATEVGEGLPTAVTVASSRGFYAESIARIFHSTSFRTYTSNDVIGVELGGSIKNVLAISAGISDGLGYGANARAALITRGLAEIMRLGTHLGGQRETFMGLAGVGDLVLTCTDDQSRNRRLGLALGRGEAIDEAVEAIGQAVEGLHTARELDALAHKHQVDMPITQQVKRVLFDKASPADAVSSLLARDSKPELI